MDLGVIYQIQQQPDLGFMTVLGLVISAGLSLLASLLLAKKQKAPVNRDDAPSTYSSPDDFTPYLEGTRKQGYCVGWVGDRKTVKSGGGGKGGGGGGETISNYEGAWHILGPGPYTELTQITSANEVIWSGCITPVNTPSGTRVSAGKYGSFLIWWGEENQPICNYLANKLVVDSISIASRWPGVAFIIWDRFNKEGGQQWPQIEYLLRRRMASSLSDSDGWLNDGTSEGANAAHAICRIITAAPTYGGGIASSTIDEATLEDVGELCASEHLPINYLSEGGQQPDTIETFMQAVATDIGIMYPQIGESVAFISVRQPSGSVPSYTADEIADPVPEIIIKRQPTRPDIPRFSFTDEDYNYRSVPLDDPDDSMHASGLAARYSNATIDTITNKTPATLVSKRRQQEPGGTGDEIAVRISLTRGGRLQHPGSYLDATDIGRLRVVSRRLIEDSTRVELECLLDSYAVEATSQSFANGTSTSSDNLDAEPDTSFIWLNVPEELTTNEGTIVVFRVRAHDQIDGATIYVSLDGGAYTLVGNQDIASAGGELLGSLAAGTADVESGPIFEAQDSLAADILDLSSNPTAWDAGQQLALFVNAAGTVHEMTFLREVTVQSEMAWAATTAKSIDDVVTPTGSGVTTGLRYVCTTSGTTGSSEPDWTATVGNTVTDGTVVWTAHYLRYQAMGLKRAKYGTTDQAFSAGDQVYIIERDSLSQLRSSVIDPGSTICLKTRPFAGGDEVDLSEVTAVCGAVDLWTSGTGQFFSY